MNIWSTSWLISLMTFCEQACRLWKLFFFPSLKKKNNFMWKKKLISCTKKSLHTKTLLETENVSVVRVDFLKITFLLYSFPLSRPIALFLFLQSGTISADQISDTAIAMSGYLFANAQKWLIKISCRFQYSREEKRFRSRCRMKIQSPNRKMTRHIRKMARGESRKLDTLKIRLKKSV